MASPDETPEEQDVVAAAESLAKEAGNLASQYENNVLGTVYTNAGDFAKIHRAIAFLAERLAQHERRAAGEDFGQVAETNAADWAAHDAAAAVTPENTADQAEPGTGNPANPGQ